MPYKNITVTKISDHGGTEKTPTHALVVTDENYQHKKTVGKLWTKSSDHGKFLSGKMSSSNTGNDGKFYDGYVIITESEYNALVENVDNGSKLTGDKALASEAYIKEENERIRQQKEEGKALLEDIPF